MFLDEKSVQNFHEVQQNLKESQVIDNCKEIKLCQKGKKSNKEFKDKNKLNEIKQKKNLKSQIKFDELSDEFFSVKITEVSLYNIYFISYFFILQLKEETNDGIYLKYHNFFEQKEIEYRGKIVRNFRPKKIQNENNKEKYENFTKINSAYNTFKENNDDYSGNLHPNIIKIML